MKELYSHIENKIKDFPPLPATVTEVMRVVNDPDSSAKDLTQAVLPDQSLCIAILKIANSALYGRPQKVASLELAIMVLGFDEVQNIVTSRAVIRSFNTMFTKAKDALTDFWEHAFVTALAAKNIAEHFNLPAPGKLFMAGLIHDIGKLAMLLCLKDKYDVQKWMRNFSSEQKFIQERKFFSVTHTEVGSKILEKWNFPKSLVSAVRHHHTPERLNQARGIPIIIQFADALAYLCSAEVVEENFTVEQALTTMLPNIKELWQTNNLPWERARLEVWYNWLSIEKKHGRSVLSILSY